MSDQSRKLIKITTEKWQDWFIVSIEEAFVLTRLDEIRTVFETIEKNHTPHVAIDLSKVILFDSSAITVLVNFQERLLAAGGKLVIFGPNEDIQNILAIACLDKVIPVLLTRANFEELYS